MKKMKQVKEHMKDINMKRLFRRNQIIITTLAVMIAAAGYLNYAGKKRNWRTATRSRGGAMDISDEDILAENQAVLNSQNGRPAAGDSQPDDPDDGSGQVAQNGADGQLAAQNGADGEQLAQGGAGRLRPPRRDSATAASRRQTPTRRPVWRIWGGCAHKGMSVSDHIANAAEPGADSGQEQRDTDGPDRQHHHRRRRQKQQAIQDMIDLTEVSEKGKCGRNPAWRPRAFRSGGQHHQSQGGCGDQRGQHHGSPARPRSRTSSSAKQRCRGPDHYPLLNLAE